MLRVHSYTPLQVRDCLCTISEEQQPESRQASRNPTSQQIPDKPADTHQANTIRAHVDGYQGGRLWFNNKQDEYKVKIKVVRLCTDGYCVGGCTCS